MTTPNRERLIRLAHWVSAEEEKRQQGLPSEWDQSMWLVRKRSATCGTACCLAGKVAMEDGAKPIPRDPDTTEREWSDVEDGNVASRFRLPDGTVNWVDGYAQRVLGLNDHQADRLFAGSNDLNDVLDVIEDIIGERIEVAP